MKSVKKLTLLALFTTIALIIFVIESAIPPIVPIPGVKLGLANIVTLLLIVNRMPKEAAVVLLMRIFLASIFAGQMMSFFFSLLGGIFCLIAMTLSNRLLRASSFGLQALSAPFFIMPDSCLLPL